MTAVLEPRTPPSPPSVDLSPKRGWRAAKNHVMTGLMAVCLVLAVIPLVAVLFQVVSEGLAVVLADFPAWFTDSIPIRSRRPGPGMARPGRQDYAKGWAVPNLSTGAHS